MSVIRRPTPGSNPESPAAPDHGDGSQTPLGADADQVDLDAEALRDISDEIARDFAPELGRTALVLYDLDPTHLQAQWCVAPEDLAYALGAFPGEPAKLRQVLRLCRLEQDGRSQAVETFDQGPGTLPSRGQEGFAVVGDGASYECELGLESADGGWLLLVRSNRIEMALPAVSPTGIGSSVGEVLAREQRQFLADESSDVPVEPALAAVSGPLDPVFPNPGPVIDPSPRRRYLPEAEATYRKNIRDRALNTLPSAPGGTAPDSGRVAHDPVSPASESMPPPRLPSDQGSAMGMGEMPGPLYDPRAALSSAALRGTESRGGDLEVWAELLLHGKGRPGARVELFGLPVRVEADGHFSVRRTVDAALLLSLALGRDAAPKFGDPNAE